MVQSVERYFKAYIVDKNSSIASAALVSAYHLYPKAESVAKRWVSEALEALSPKSSSSFFAAAQSSSLGGPSGYLGFGSSAPATPTMVSIPSTSYISQYHALGFLYGIRQSDRMAVTKMIQQLGGGKSGAGTSLKNPMALCMLIRYASKIMHEDPKYVLVSLFLASFLPFKSLQKPMFDLLEGWLRHKSDMVNYEAARAICQMRGVTAPQLTRSIAQLQLFLSSPKPTLKFAAIRTLSALAVSHPSSVAACNVDMENLISDPNRSIATYAITTLLKVRLSPQ